jgi:hypothetical protein|tara:strand:- start:1124 stop:1279 length:156 start_codon:yes stop_codon:yes gene_type:complete
MTTHDVSLHVYDLRCAREDATTRRDATRRDAMKHLLEDATTRTTRRRRRGD